MSWKQVRRHQQWLAEEKGSFRRPEGGRIRVALAYPNRYAVGMSNLGFQAVYGRLNALADVGCERVFYPEPEDLPSFRDHSEKLLSLETNRPVGDFHLLAFSVSYENDYPNLLEMLRFAGIPPKSSDRNASHPLVAAGGVAVFLNPEPLAPFIDFFFIGEAEALLTPFWEHWKTLEGLKLDRSALLRTLGSQCPGIYVPSLYEPVFDASGRLEALVPTGEAPARVAFQRADLSREAVCRTVVLTPHTEFSDVCLVELGRGCGRACRFCAAGFVYRPPRYHTAAKILAAAREELPRTSRLGLVSAAVSDHPEIRTLCPELVQAGASLSFSSLRADGVSDELLAALDASGHQAVAIAAEAGSGRLRRVINKHLSEDQILQAAERLTEFGVFNLKLYFMIGLPTETREDVWEIVELTKRIKHHVLQRSRGRKRLGTITLSVNSFVPKPFTPFQWVPFAGVGTLKERARWIKAALGKVANVRVHFDVPKWAYVQALLARGDRRVAGFLEKVALDGLSWSEAYKVLPYNPDFWVMRERDRDEPFPWEVVDYGLRRSFLWEEYRKGLDEKESPFCMPEKQCRRCGVCG
jgi:radical SAM superfamily enzyme YgiQ (UPF0313 family)